MNLSLGGREVVASLRGSGARVLNVGQRGASVIELRLRILKQRLCCLQNDLCCFQLADCALHPVELRGGVIGKRLTDAAQTKRRGDLESLAAVKFWPAPEVEQGVFELEPAEAIGSPTVT